MLETVITKYGKIFLIFLAFFLTQLFIGYQLIEKLTISQAKDFLNGVDERVKEDIKFKNGQWDTTSYSADPDLPGTYPLYVLSNDGFVIDRWKPVHGFLDDSDYKHLLTFQKAQTIHTITNQDWRIYSQPIIDNAGKILGVIAVSNFNPDPNDLSNIDKKLENSAQIISQHIRINGSDISTSQLDSRVIPYDIAFQVVNQFNQILAKNNNTNSIDQIPNFIDPSYVASALKNTGVKQIQDSQTKENFLVSSQSILDNNGNLIGIVIGGKSIDFLNQLLKSFLIFELLIGIVLILVFSLISREIFSESKNIALLERKMIKKITFDKKESVLYINDLAIEIPYSTNQYYLCEALFSAPRKKWESDELIKKFGEDTEKNSWRKIYDTMVHVNKKLSSTMNDKLILNQDRIFQINPGLLSKIG